MKVALCSDLHLEFADLEIKNDQNVDVLILGGDILIARDMYDFPGDYVNPHGVRSTRMEVAFQFRDFLANCSREFPHVVYIMGNHELYHGKWHQTAKILVKECEAFSNIHFLNNETWTLNDVTFIGGTLWTDMNRGDPLTVQVVTDGLNDYRQIKHEDRNYSSIRAEDTINEHRKMLDLIKKTVDDKPGKYVVVGHHAPSKLSTKPRYENDYHMNGGYSSNLEEFILDRPDIVLWTHGHTHHEFDYMMGETRIVCNPRGYVGYERSTQEEEPYYPKIIEI